MRNFTLLFFFLLMIVSLPACKKEAPPPPPQVQQPAVVEPTISGRTGVVAETMAADGYTFVFVDGPGERFWAAAPEFPVKPGDAIIVPEGTEMADFHSNGLNRTFEKILFVDSIALAGAAQPSQTPQTTSPAPAR